MRVRRSGFSNVRVCVFVGVLIICVLVLFVLYCLYCIVCTVLFVLYCLYCIVCTVLFVLYCLYCIFYLNGNITFCLDAYCVHVVYVSTTVFIAEGNYISYIFRLLNSHLQENFLHVNHRMLCIHWDPGVFTSVKYLIMVKIQLKFPLKIVYYKLKTLFLKAILNVFQTINYTLNTFTFLDKRSDLSISLI